MRHVFLFLALTVVSEMSYTNGRPIHTNKTRIKRVVGGTEVQYGYSPYLVLILAEIPNSYFWGIVTSTKTVTCGASLIDKQWILTAAHCLYNNDNEIVSPYYWQAKLGDIYKSTSYVGYLKGLMSDILFKPEWANYYVKVQGLYIHPYYTGTNYYRHDIALMKLAHRVDLNLPLDENDRLSGAIKNYNPSIINQRRRIGVIHMLPYEMRNLTKNAPTECILKGWGCREKGGGGSDVAYQIKMKLDRIDTCRFHWGRITATRLCASGVNRLENACQGDSGSPLTCMIDDVNFQVGITSFKSTVVNRDIPVVFTRVAAYTDWIIDVTTGKKR